MSWDLWVEYNRGDADGLVRTNARNVRPGLVLKVGDVIAVGNEDADSAQAEVVEIGDGGVVVVRVRDWWNQ